MSSTLEFSFGYGRRSDRLTQALARGKGTTCRVIADGKVIAEIICDEMYRRAFWKLTPNWQVRTVVQDNTLSLTMRMGHLLWAARKNLERESIMRECFWELFKAYQERER